MANLRYDWEHDIAPHINNLASVDGGFTAAHRGIATLADGTKAFVKIATDDNTTNWLRKEIIVYQRLNNAGYAYMPQLLAHNHDQTAMAITYLATASFENVWDDDKLGAIVKAQESLKQYKHLFEDDPMFKADDVVDTTNSKWPGLVLPHVVEKLNERLTLFGVDIKLTLRELQGFADKQAGWSPVEDTLIHEDIRADNFGYDERTKTGCLIDWNWLCVGDTSLDTTTLFINMYLSGYDPYKLHPEKYDEQMLIYVMGFWFDSILRDHDGSEREQRRNAAQAKSAAACYKVLTS